jgi:hypothetical protein
VERTSRSHDRIQQRQVQFERIDAAKKKDFDDICTAVDRGVSATRMHAAETIDDLLRTLQMLEGKLRAHSFRKFDPAA